MWQRIEPNKCLVECLQFSWLVQLGSSQTVYGTATVYHTGLGDCSVCASQISIALIS